MELRADMVGKLINRYKIEVVMMSISVLTITASMIIMTRTPSGNNVIEPITCSESINEPKSHIQVDLSGAVIKPDVYILPKGTRLKELIELGGGLQDMADVNYINYQYNFASELKDEQKIFIPFKGAPNLNLQRQPSSQQSQIHINSADKSQLESLPNIGEITAEKIINNRPYKSTQELVNNKVINKSTYDKISELIDL